MAGCRTCDQEVASSIHGQGAAAYDDSGHRAYPVSSIDVNKRSNKNIKTYKNVRKRDKNLKKTFVNVIKNVTSS